MNHILSSVPKKTSNFFVFSKGAYFWCLHLSVSYMSSLLELVVTGVASFFSSGADEKGEGDKKKKNVTATTLIC